MNPVPLAPGLAALLLVSCRSAALPGHEGQMEHGLAEGEWLDTLESELGHEAFRLTYRGVSSRARPRPFARAIVRRQRLALGRTPPVRDDLGIMSDTGLATDLPEPPYYAVVFSTRRSAGDRGYAAMAERMLELARARPGFLGVESVRDAEGIGITVSYWRDEASIAAWKQDAEHLVAQRRGASEWYEAYELRVARVERAWGLGARAR